MHMSVRTCFATQTHTSLPSRTYMTERQQRLTSELRLSSAGIRRFRPPRSKRHRKRGEVSFVLAPHGTPRTHKHTLTHTFSLALFAFLSSVSFENEMPSVLCGQSQRETDVHGREGKAEQSDSQKISANTRTHASAQSQSRRPCDAAYMPRHI